jgi:hypothetical protein
MYCEDDMYFLWFGLVVVGLWSEKIFLRAQCHLLFAP